jgi:RNA polymerase sigma factor (sigma-70 family)
MQAHASERDWSAFMARAQDGDREAYRRLLEGIAPYLRFLARRRLRDSLDVEDAVQDVLLTVHAVRHTYDPARPFGPWLVAIANRRIVDALRRYGRTRLREEAFAEEHETLAAPEANLPGGGMDARALCAVVERLPQGQRQAVRLLKLEEMSLKEAAVVTGMSIAALKVATHRGLKNLRKLIASEGGGK